MPRRKKINWVVRQTPRGLWVVYPEGARHCLMWFKTKAEADDYMTDPSKYDGEEIPLRGPLAQALGQLGREIGGML